MTWNYQYGRPVWTGALPMTVPTVPTLAQRPLVGGLRQFVVGDFTGYGLTEDGRIKSVFSGNSADPDEVHPATSGFVAVSVGGGGALGAALTADGHITPFGRAGGTPDMVADTKDLPTGPGHVQVAMTGTASGYALTSTGAIVPFGDATQGERANVPTGTGFVQVAAGLANGYALTSKGGVVAFGAGTPGAVGPYTSIHTDKDLPASGVVQIAAGVMHGYGLTADGHVVAFGEDSQHQRDNLPAQGGFVYIAASAAGGCALTGDGRVVLFGDPSHNAQQYLPTGAGFVRLEAGYFHESSHCIAITAEGHFVVFGGNADQIHDPGNPKTFAIFSAPKALTQNPPRTVRAAVTVGTDTPLGLPYEIDWGDKTSSPVPVGTATGTEFAHTYATAEAADGTAVRLVYPAATRSSAAGNPVATTVLDTATVTPAPGHWDYSHGSPPVWRGAGPMTVPALPKLDDLPQYGPLRQFAAARKAGYGITTDGHLVAVGNPNPSYATLPKAGGFVQVSGSGFCGCALDPTGRPVAFGDLTASAGTRVPPFFDQDLPTTGGFVQIATGGWGGYLLNASGGVIGFGDPGNGRRTNLPATGIVQIAATQYGGYGLTTDGRIVALGTQTLEHAHNLPPGGGFVQIAAGTWHGYALHADGHIVCFGDHSRHQTDGLPVTGKHTYVAATGSSGYALNAAGEVLMFGASEIGQKSQLPVGDGWRILTAGGAGGYVVTADGHMAVIGGEPGQHEIEVPLWPVKFSERSLPATGTTVTAMVASKFNHPWCLAGPGVPTRLPWEIDWGDGTPNTPIPVGTTATDRFTHSYHDGVMHTAKIVYPAAVRTSSAGNRIAHMAVDSVPANNTHDLWDFSHGPVPRWTGPMPMTVPPIPSVPPCGPVQQIEGAGTGVLVINADGTIDVGGNRMETPPTGSDIAMVSAGIGFRAVLTRDGRIHATSSPDRLTNVPTGDEFVQIACHSFGGYALTRDGRIVAFGQTSAGQAADLPTTDGFVQVVAGGSSGYALTKDGHIVAFGDNKGGQRDHMPAIGGFVQLCADGATCYALDGHGAITPLGYSGNGQHGLPAHNTGFVHIDSGGFGGYALTDTGAIVPFGHSTIGYEQDLPTGDGFVQATAIGFHGYGLTPDGHVIAFGEEGKYGHGTRDNMPVRSPLPAATTVRPDAQGGVSVPLANTPTRVPWEIDWGDGTVEDVPVGTVGPLAHTYTGSTTRTAHLRYPLADRAMFAGNQAATTPVATVSVLPETGRWDYSHGSPPVWRGPLPMTVPTLPTLAELPLYGPLRQIAAGGFIGYGIEAAGKLVALGRQGPGRNNMPKTGVFVQVSAHDYIGLALDAAGTISGIGNVGKDSSGGTQVPHTKGMPTTGGFVQVACGSQHGYALTAAGRIVAFGDSAHDQQKDLPTGDGFVQVVATSSGGIALTKDGHVVAFGDVTYNNRDGVPTTGGFVQLAAGAMGGYALHEDGHVVAFGDSSRHERDGLPKGPLVCISAAAATGYGLDAAGSIVRWGDKSVKQDQNLPLGSGWKMLSAGSKTCYFVDSSGHIAVSGDTALGQHEDVPLWPPQFSSRTLSVLGGTAYVVLRDGVHDPTSLSGPAVPTRLPYEIDWGDGTPNTPVPVGSGESSTFSHVYASGGPEEAHEVRLVYPAATRASAVGNELATASVDTIGAKDLFVWDGKRWVGHDAYVWDGKAWQFAELNVWLGAEWIQ